MVIDTNVYSALDKGDSRAVEALDGVKHVCMPIFVIAELMFGFAKGSKTDENRKTLLRFLSLPNVSVGLPSFETAEQYAKLQLHSANKGKVLSHNDLWIAALACERGESLVTFDRDFSALEELLGDLLAVLK